LMLTVAAWNRHHSDILRRRAGNQWDGQMGMSEKTREPALILMNRAYNAPVPRERGGWQSRCLVVVVLLR
jgi:hypothetical protein